MYALLISLCLVAGILRAPLPPATPMPTPKRDVFRAPNSQFTATLPFYSGRIVMTAADGRRAVVTWPKWFAFIAWTRDSRFAIMNYYDQYGNTWGQAFDTQKWALIELVSAVKGHVSCRPTMEGNCKEGAKALLKDGSGILLYDGTVVPLANLAK